MKYYVIYKKEIDHACLTLVEEIVGEIQAKSFAQEKRNEGWEVKLIFGNLIEF